MFVKKVRGSYENESVSNTSFPVAVTYIRLKMQVVNELVREKKRE